MSHVTAWSLQSPPVPVAFILAYIEEFRKKYQAFRRPFSELDQDLVNQFLVFSMMALRSKPDSKALFSVRERTESKQGAKKHPQRGLAFMRSVEQGICGHFQWGECDEAGPSHSKSVGGTVKTVRHVCVACKGSHPFKDCDNASAKASFA